MNIAESIYIHFPICKNICNYCDFYKFKPDNFEQNILDFESLINEQMKLLTNYLKESDIQLAELKTIFIGGGTPSLWGNGLKQFMFSFFKKNKLKLHSDYEWTIEVNPSEWTEQSYEGWKEIGVNRYSFGVQSFNENFLKILDRKHSVDEAKKTLSYFANQGENISCDLMIGLPFSDRNKRNIEHEIDQAIDCGINHISLYILTVKSNYKWKEFLPSEEYIENEYLKVCEYLDKKNLNQYEVSNFSRKGFESKHNLKYWHHDTVLALGPSATGFINKGGLSTRYKWDNSQSTKWHWESLSEKEKRLEQIYLNLRSKTPLNFNQFFDLAEMEKLDQVLNNWLKSKYIDSQNPIVLSSKGLLILDELMNDLFRHCKSL